MERKKERNIGREETDKNIVERNRNKELKENGGKIKWKCRKRRKIGKAEK